MEDTTDIAMLHVIRKKTDLRTISIGHFPPVDFTKGDVTEVHPDLMPHIVDGETVCGICVDCNDQEFTSGADFIQHNNKFHPAPAAKKSE